MRRLCKSLCLVAALVAMLYVPVSAERNPVISPEFPGDDYMDGDKDNDKDKNEIPGDDYQKEDRSPKTGDNSLALYGMAMAAIAVAGTIVIANKKEA